ncbi:hypothetical protein F5884DRAFT_774905 [Xylogone sp. PMI_703]|nr:hypothetical protein F5884DRAFT_774905 [Xylogone sp. PMI_703]
MNSWTTCIPIRECPKPKDPQLGSHIELKLADDKQYTEIDTNSEKEIQAFPLFNFPAELVSDVVKFLPPESKTAISFTCHYFHAEFEKETVNPFLDLKHRQKDEFYNFLALIEKEFPDHVPCATCRCLHHITAQDVSQYIPKLGRSSLDDPYLQIHRGRNESYDGMAWYYSTPIFLMTMKRFRQGRDCTEFLELMSPKELRFCNPLTIEWSSSIAKICAPRLLVRHQVMFTQSPTKYQVSWRRQLCPHLMMDIALGRVTFMDETKALPPPGTDDVNKYYKSISCVMKESELYQCPYCYTEFQIDFRKLGENSSVMYCTMWQDFGEGTSEFEPKWLSHIKHSPLREANFEPGSIKMEFEGGCEFEADSVITSAERDDLAKVAGALESGKFGDNFCKVREALTEFFEHREDWHIGSKDPMDLFGYRVPGYDKHYYYN